ncbi:MAG: competence/damage-inducible protein A [Halorhabdus sp.]
MGTTGAILTIGDELLAGDVENTNATWLAARLTERGVEVREVRVVPDERKGIEQAVTELGSEQTFVVTTGGLGSTPDDITIDAVAAALNRSLEPNPEARRLVKSAVAEIREEYPEFEYDLDAGSRYPEDARILPNEAGISPGCVCGNVYVLPGIPDEMRAVFGMVADEFDGDIASRTLYTETPESHLNEILTEAGERYDVRVGCYPNEEHKRIRLVNANEESLEAATEWLAAQPEISSRGDGPEH